MGTIRFYRAGDAYGQFSNFFPVEVTVGGTTYPTSEHPFQVWKFLGSDPEWADKIAKAPKPGLAAKWGRSREHPLRPDWESIKDDVMRLVVYRKFTQHPRLRKFLLVTGDLDLVEHTVNDRYWADGGDGTGKNMLGKILMEVRAVIQKPESEQEAWVGSLNTGGENP